MCLLTPPPVIFQNSKKLLKIGLHPTTFGGKNIDSRILNKTKLVKFTKLQIHKDS